MTSVPQIVVIGGGSTGIGIARDLSMRGLDVTLVEQGNLTHGTTGRMHGLLHSGGRYAVSDQMGYTPGATARSRPLRRRHRPARRGPRVPPHPRGPPWRVE